MKMLVGLTGKTGSGKSFAAKSFERLGAFVADCDVIAHEVLKDDAIREKLCAVFSTQILDKDNNIDRKALGRIVFADNKKLSLLNGIMHGEIIRRALMLCQNSGKDICIIDGSELEASGIDEKCDYVIVISANEDIRLKRIMARDNLDRESALRRMGAQKDYSKDAIFIINDEGKDALAEKINTLYNRFLGELNA